MDPNCKTCTDLSDIQFSCCKNPASNEWTCKTPAKRELTPARGATKIDPGNDCNAASKAYKIDLASLRHRKK